MKMNNIGYLLKEGVRGIFLHGFMSFAAVCVTVACLLIVGSFSILVYNVNIIVEDLNKTNQIIAYVDESLPEAEAHSIGSQISKIDNVYKAEFVTRDEALEDFVDDYQEESAFSGIEASDLRHRHVVTLMDNSKMEQTEKALSRIPGIVKLSSNKKLAEGFITLQNVLHIASITVIAVLLVVSLLIISNTVKIAMYDRRDEIAIMKMVGATNGFIRLPFVVEGFVLGMVGAAVAFGLEWLMYDALLLRLSTAGSAANLLSFVPFTDLLWPMLITFGAAGLFVGVVGSWTSIRKFMDV